MSHGLVDRTCYVPVWPRVITIGVRLLTVELVTEFLVGLAPPDCHVNAAARHADPDGAGPPVHRTGPARRSRAAGPGGHVSRLPFSFLGPRGGRNSQAS